MNIIKITTEVKYKESRNRKEKLGRKNKGFWNFRLLFSFVSPSLTISDNFLL